MLFTPDGTIKALLLSLLIQQNNKQTTAFWKQLGDIIMEELTRTSTSLNLFKESPSIIFRYTIDENQE